MLPILERDRPDRSRGSPRRALRALRALRYSSTIQAARFIGSTIVITSPGCVPGQTMRRDPRQPENHQGPFWGTGGSLHQERRVPLEECEHGRLRHDEPLAKPSLELSADPVGLGAIHQSVHRRFVIADCDVKVVRHGVEV